MKLLKSAYTLAMAAVMFAIGWYFLKHRTTAWIKGSEPSNSQRIVIAWVSFAAAAALVVSLVVEAKRRS